jgi:hypothetical protein
MSPLAPLAALALAVAPPSRALDAPRSPTAKLLVLEVGALPQLEQLVGSSSHPAEVYRAEALFGAGRWRLGPEVMARRDFAIVGFGVHRVLRVTDAREWRLGLGLGYLLPFGATETLYERMGGGGSSTLDRLHLRAALGQTFGLRGGVGLRVEYGVRLMRRGSVLSVLESLDDGLGSAEGFWTHEILAGLEIRGSGSP